MCSRYCENKELIENYEKAKSDNFVGWHCHHRLETHTSDGERRLVDITMEELNTLNMYYHRPPEELIFMRIEDHYRLHNKGKYLKEETKRKLSDVLKGKNTWMKGRKLSEETKRKISEAMKGKNKGKSSWSKDKHFSEDHKKKLSYSNKGKHRSNETRNRLSESHKGRRWFNNGEISIMCFECPEGFVPGRLKK